MNRQLIKEFRALILPCSVAVLMTILMQFGKFLVMVQVIESGTFVSFVFGLILFAFFSSLLAIAAFPLGIEFQHRTLPLLFSQPIPRSRIWRQKLVTTLLGIGMALLVLVLASIIADKGATVAATKPKNLVITPIAPTVQSNLPAPTSATKLKNVVITPIAPTVQSNLPAGMSREQAEIYQRRYGINPLSTGLAPSQSRSVRHIEDLPPVSEICLVVCALLLPTLGSVTFWTLLARSTLGGMVFTAFSQLLVCGILAFISERLDLANNFVGIRNLSDETAIFAVAGIVYSAIFFVLSWRKFCRLEVSQILPDTLAGSKSLSARGLRLGWLRCRPAGSFLNLIRKEIQLQKPLYIIAAILCVVWLLTYILQVLQPSRRSFPEIVFALTMGFYIPLMSLLSGCVSLGEEKNLGIPAWHLTFPVPIWRQWAVKLVVGLGAWILLGLILPFGLSRFGLVVGGSRIFGQVELEGWLGVALFTTGAFAMSFWAITLFSNTVRAVIGTIVTVVALCSSVAFASWLMLEWVFPRTFLQTLVIYEPHWGDVVIWFQLGATTALLALVQSFLQFRRLQTPSKTIVKYACTLVAFVFLGAICNFLLLPVHEYWPVVYILLFALVLTFVRRMVRLVPTRAG